MRERMLASSIMALALVFGAGSLALFIAFPLGSLAAVRANRPNAGVLLWDGLLSLAFFLQHSGMVRRQFRDRISGVVPPRYHRALYSFVSGVVLASVVVLWRPSEVHLLLLEGPFRWVAHALAVTGISLFFWGWLSLRGLDLFGVGPIRAYLRGTAEPSPVFIARGAYRWVRHPWYLGAILLFWSCADLTADRLLFNVLWTVWICIGAKLEEADLRRDFGPVYDKYRRQVPMLVPWHHTARGVSG